MQPSQNDVSAILWVLLSTFLWTVIFAAGKLADGAVGSFQLTFLRYCGALIALIALLPSQGGIRAHGSKQPWSHLARAVCGCGAAVAITWASANMPLIDATAIGMLYGVLATLLGTLVLKESVGRTRWFAIVVALLGVTAVMASKGAFSTGFVIVPAIVAFASAVFFAAEGLLIAVLGRSERAFTVMLYVTVFGLLLMLLPAVLEWRSISLGTGLACLLSGPLGLVAQYCTIRGYRSAPLSIVAPVDYAWLPFSALLGVVVFDEIPSAGTGLGCMAIVLGGVLLACSGGRKPETANASRSADS
ncbi:MAG: DMT family transporter [Pseudomonadota bacterium]